MPPQRHILRWPEERIEMAFRLIPVGEFRMGSRGYDVTEEPIHIVKIPDDFWLAETPVTQAQFALWTKAEKIGHENNFTGRPDHPAENMDWRQAQAYCAWLTGIKGDEFPDGYTVACLPTEAEWEYACRAGTETEYYTGDGEAALAEAGWFRDNSEQKTHPVSRKHPNAYGLYDMHGNVWEWCHDIWDNSTYRRQPDGSSDPGYRKRLDDWREGLEKMVASDQTRVLRGGSWYNFADWCRSAFRNWRMPVVRNRDVGFRVCLVRGPAARRGAQQTEREKAEPAPGDGGRGTSPESDGAGEADSRIPDLSQEKLPPRSGSEKIGRKLGIGISNLGF